MPDTTPHAFDPDTEIRRHATMTALAFNIGALAGSLLIFAGVWWLAGVGAGLLSLGAMVWSTTMLGAWLAHVRRS